MPIIKVTSEDLPQGALPVYDLGSAWPYPVYTVSEDGESVLRLEPGKSRYLLPEFTLEDESPHGLQRKVVDRITTMCLCARFAGAAKVAVRNDMVVTSPNGAKEPPVVYCFSCAMLFTVDWDPDLKGFGYTAFAGGWKIPAEINDLGCESDNREFQDTVTVMEVLLT